MPRKSKEAEAGMSTEEQSTEPKPGPKPKEQSKHVWVVLFLKGNTDSAQPEGAILGAFEEKEAAVTFAEKHVDEFYDGERDPGNPMPIPPPPQRQDTTWEYLNRCDDPHIWSVREHTVQASDPEEEQGSAASRKRQGPQPEKDAAAGSAAPARKSSRRGQGGVPVAVPNEEDDGRSVWALLELTGNSDSSYPEGGGVLGVFHEQDPALRFGRAHIAKFWRERQAEKPTAADEEEPRQCGEGAWTFTNALDDCWEWTVQRYAVA